MRIYELVKKPIQSKPPMTLPQARIQGLKNNVEQDRERLRREREQQHRQREAERTRRQRQRTAQAF